MGSIRSDQAGLNPRERGLAFVL